jgi:hypothetical protein
MANPEIVRTAIAVPDLVCSPGSAFLRRGTGPLQAWFGKTWRPRPHTGIPPHRSRGRHRGPGSSREAPRNWRSRQITLDGGAAVLKTLAGVMDDFDPGFNIVTLTGHRRRP